MYRTYLFRYFHEGAWWQVEMTATSPDDARARMQKLPLAQLDGELVAKLPASAGLIARAFCWLNNSVLFRKVS